MLVIWPSKSQIRKVLPKILYRKIRTIIDCTETYNETPGSLDYYCLLSSYYEHYTTIKILVCITRNGAISWVFSAYVERTSDAFIVRDSRFLDLLLLKRYLQIMADRGFKIKTDLA